MEFILYGKFDCYPCKAMLQDIKQLNTNYSFEIRTVDIREDLQLMEQYGSRIPVLVAGGVELCHFTLDTEKVTSYLCTEGSIGTSNS